MPISRECHGRVVGERAFEIRYVGIDVWRYLKYLQSRLSGGRTREIVHTYQWSHRSKSLKGCQQI